MVLRAKGSGREGEGMRDITICNRRCHLTTVAFSVIFAALHALMRIEQYYCGGGLGNVPKQLHIRKLTSHQSRLADNVASNQTLCYKKVERYGVCQNLLNRENQLRIPLSCVLTVHTSLKLLVLSVTDTK